MILGGGGDSAAPQGRMARRMTMRFLLAKERRSLTAQLEATERGLDADQEEHVASGATGGAAGEPEPEALAPGPSRSGGARRIRTANKKASKSKSRKAKEQQQVEHPAENQEEELFQFEIE